MLNVFILYMIHLICYFQLGDCDFEKGKCTWTNSPNVVADEFDWTRQSGTTASVSTGPQVDHTTNSKTGVYCEFKNTTRF